MADRFAVGMMNELQRRNVTVRQSTYVGVWGSVVEVDVSDKVIEIRDSAEYELYNAHPSEKGSITFPPIEIEMNNSDGTFTIGNANGVFPGGLRDFERKARIRVKVTLEGGGVSQVVYENRGFLREPSYEAGDRAFLFAEHPLNHLTTKEWSMAEHAFDSTGVVTCVLSL